MATILIVDDEKGYRDFLEKYLQRLGFMAFSVATSEQALEFIQSVRPDLVLLDWVLKKGIPAPDLLRALKSHPKTRGVPVVVMSGIRDEPEDEAKARQAGAVLFISKGEISDETRDRDTFHRHLRSLIIEARLEEPGNGRATRKRQAVEPVCAGRVLVIDDDPEIREMLSTVLGGEGYIVLTADTGSLGLNKARQESPDLVLLDLTLPDMDGLDVCSRIKAVPALRPIPVVILSGRSSHETKLLATRSGADHYFTKPLESIEKFPDWVRAFVQRGAHQGDAPTTLRVEHVVVNLETKVATVAGRPVGLTPVLFRLLCEFARRPCDVLTRDYLVRAVWDGEGLDRNVDTAVGRLRHCLGLTKDWFPCLARTGYRMMPFVPGAGPASASDN